MKQRMVNLHNIVKGGDTVFLYSIIHKFSNHVFIAYILRASDTTWVFIETGPKYFASNNSHFSIAYHNDKMLVCVDVHHRCITLDDNGRGDHKTASTCVIAAKSFSLAASVVGTWLNKTGTVITLTMTPHMIEMAT